MVDNHSEINPDNYYNIERKRPAEFALSPNAASLEHFAKKIKVDDSDGDFGGDDEFAPPEESSAAIGNGLSKFTSNNNYLSESYSSANSILEEILVNVEGGFEESETVEDGDVKMSNTPRSPSKSVQGHIHEPHSPSKSASYSPTRSTMYADSHVSVSNSERKTEAEQYVCIL